MQEIKFDWDFIEQDTDITEEKLRFNLGPIDAWSFISTNFVFENYNNETQLYFEENNFKKVW